MNPAIAAVISGVIALVVGLLSGYLYRKNVMENKIGHTEAYVQNLLNDATRKAEDKKKEAVLEAKEEIIRLKSELDKEVSDRRNEVQRQERRINQREEAFDKKFDNLEAREESLNEKFKEVQRLEEEAQTMHESQQAELERISNMTMEEARQMLIARIQKEAYHDAAVSVVALPNDDMKGRIIGREGRNIRALEAATGVDLIIDDTPETVILSAYSPLRRQVAKMALERLIQDGRIHPARIEDIVQKCEQELDTQVREVGEQATFDAGVHGIHPEIVRLLGQLRYRTSFTQNVLQHSLEVSALCGMMAAELGMDVKKAKRAGLLHDIGKAVDHEVEGPHALIGADLAKKYNESQEIIHAIAAHHEDQRPSTALAVLVQAADSISGARPGARKELLENYVKRLEDLEGIATSFDGVSKAYAIQAGREIRVMVNSDMVDDDTTYILCKDIAEKIEKNLTYPGQIRVTVIRERRAVGLAK